MDFGKVMRPELNSNRLKSQTALKCLQGNLHGDFTNNSKVLLYMCKRYLLINANLINAKQMLCCWLIFKQ